MIEKKTRKEEESTKPAEDRFPQVVCFNCGEPGHYNTACKSPRVCFICLKEDHVSEKCPEWKKALPAAQFFGSANSGLGFYHIDVEEREDRFKHWSGFDNYGIFTVEEGELDEEGVLQALRELCDRDWQWKLMKMEDYKYLVRFPPHKRVDSNVIGKASYFYLRNDTVMAPLRIWNGDIEPVGTLTETWVQIRGIPPKWCDWTTIREIASSLESL